MDKKKIIIDAVSILSPFTGIGKYTYEISKELREEREFEWYYNYGYHSKKLYSPDNNSKNGSFAKKLKKIMTSNPYTKYLSREFFTQLTKVFTRSYDLYWQPNFIPNPNIKAKKLITTIHDFSFYLYPQWQPAERVKYFNKRIWREAIKSDFLITGSNFSKAEIIEYFNYPEERIEVINHGIDHSIYKIYKEEELKELKIKYNLPKNYILFVGSIEPRKNLINLLFAYQKLPKEIKREIPLLLCGFKGWNNREIMNLIEKERKYIRYLGYLTDIELAGIYNLATIFIYPSLYEGFGIPPLEAFACGTPVISSNVSSLPEACGESALFINPNSPEDIKEKIIQLLEDKELRDEMRKRGLIHSQSFSWEKSAQKHLELFKKII